MAAGFSLASATRVANSISSTLLRTVWGTIPWRSLWATCTFLRRSVSSRQARIDAVIRSAYRIALPLALRAARPTVWIRERALRRNPSLSASSIATSDTSGRSSPSRSRLIPTSTSIRPSRSARRISIRSIASMSACMYRTRIPSERKYSAKSSAIRFVRVVTSTRSPRSERSRISSSRSSTWPRTGRTSTGGSSKPVGRMICSTTTPPQRSSSMSPGVAETNTTCFASDSHSSKRSGRLSNADGSRNPCWTSVSFRERSPLYIP